MQNALSDTIDDRGWKQAAKEFGEVVGQKEAERQKEGATEQQEEETVQATTGRQRNEGGEGTNRGGRGEDARETHEGHGQRASEEGRQEEDEGEDDMQYPESPRPRRANPNAGGYGGWDAIDNVTVDQCARMPMGMQTVEFIPNSL